jgi:serine carboxypeptidase-like clade I
MGGWRRTRVIIAIGWWFVYWVVVCTTTNNNNNKLISSSSYDSFVDALPYRDEILSLPLYHHRPLPSPQFSGYLNGTDGCDTAVNGPDCYIHYWFCLAENEKEKEEEVEEKDSSTSATNRYLNDYPVVLWLNGGPGSSSILGLLQELGPLLFNGTGDGFMENPYSWTKIPVNLLILESPMGVGYSYCSAQEMSPDGVCHNTDQSTASTARAAIVDFFVHKFPEFANNPFYMTGESYAGVYIPTLTYELLQYNRHAVAAAAAAAAEDNNHQDSIIIINLQGIAVGDPCTDNVAQQDSMDALWYSHKYGFVDDQIFDVLWNTCQVRVPTMLLRAGTVRIPQKKHRNNDRRHNGLYHDSVVRRRRRRRQSMYQKIVYQQQQLQTNGMRSWRSMTTGTTNNNNTAEYYDICDLAWKKFLFSSSNGLSQDWDELYVDDYSLYAFVNNDEDTAMQQYMNRADVREALHVTQTPHVTQWPYPDAGFDYTKEYNACNDDAVGTDAPSMIDFYVKIIPHLPSGTWIYNGNTDPCVSYEGTRTAVKRIGYDELDGGSYRPWFYNHTATSVEVLQEKAILFGPNLVLQNAGIQMGGEVTNYENGLCFLTIHGSGHMVPQFRPQAAFHFLSKFLHSELLSPYLPCNASLLNLTDSDFYDVMDAWTVAAKSAPYVIAGN